jgi:hypothetical protein
MGLRVQEEGGSEGRPVMGRIGVAIFTARETGQTFLWCGRTREDSQPALERSEEMPVAAGFSLRRLKPAATERHFFRTLLGSNADLSAGS